MPPAIAESHCISQRCATANYPAASFDLRPVIEESIEGTGVIAARSPVEGSLRMAANKRCVYLGAVRDQCGHSRFTVWKVGRPVGGYVGSRVRFPSILAVTRLGFSLKSCSNNAKLPTWIA